MQSCEAAKIVDTGALTTQLAELYAHSILVGIVQCIYQRPQLMLVDMQRCYVYRIPVSIRYNVCNTHHTKNTLPEILLLIFPSLSGSVCTAALISEGCTLAGPLLQCTVVGH